MRYRVRALCLTVSTFLLLYLYITDRLPASLADLPSFNDIGSNYEYGEISGAEGSYESVETLWEHWSNIIYKNRPRTGRIHLSSNAHIVSTPANDYEPRKPPHNRVSNSESDIESLRSSHAAFLETLKSEDIEAGSIYKGTGIVTVGGGEYFGPAIISLHMLRETGCTLPVEIFVADTNEYEPALCEDYLPKYGAKCLVLSDFLKDGNGAHRFEVTHYQLKSLAMLFSSFAEILYLDSDSIPLVDPSTDLFSTEPYISNGLVIWPDFWIATESPLFYTIAGLPGFPANLPKSSSEAGQVLFNKNTHMKTLLLAVYYNIFGPGYYYPFLSQGVLGQGDKETFMAAAVVLEESYYRVKTGVTSVRRNNGQELKGSGMIQYHPSDDLLSSQFQQDGNATVVRPAFVHANTPKMNAGHLVDEGDLFSVTDQSRLRLWGSQAKQNMIFGLDLEKVVWELLVESGCELEHVLTEWKGREKLCERLQEHWKELFGEKP